MADTRRQVMRRRTLVLLIAAAAISGVSLIISTGIVRNAQRQIDPADPASLQNAVDASRWASLVEYVALPAFIVAAGVYTALWFVHQEAR